MKSVALSVVLLLAAGAALPAQAAMSIAGVAAPQATAESWILRVDNDGDDFGGDDNDDGGRDDDGGNDNDDGYSSGTGTNGTGTAGGRGRGGKRGGGQRGGGMRGA